MSSSSQYLEYAINICRNSQLRNYLFIRHYYMQCQAVWNKQWYPKIKFQNEWICLLVGYFYLYGHFHNSLARSVSSEICLFLWVDCDLWKGEYLVNRVTIFLLFNTEWWMRWLVSNAHTYVSYVTYEHTCLHAGPGATQPISWLS